MGTREMATTVGTLEVASVPLAFAIKQKMVRNILDFSGVVALVLEEKREEKLFPCGTHFHDSWIIPEQI